MQEDQEEENETKIIIKPRTIVAQERTEKSVLELFKKVGFSTKESKNFKDSAPFLIDLHLRNAFSLLNSLPRGYNSLDSGYPWIIYWISNIISISQLKQSSQNDLSNNSPKRSLSESEINIIVKMLSSLQHPRGGFCGFAGGEANLISSYAAVMAAASLGKKALEVIDVEKMGEFLMRMKNEENNDSFTSLDKNGLFLISRPDNTITSLFTSHPHCFSNHLSGESDLRSTYCAITIAYLLNLIDPEHEDPEKNCISRGVAESIANCQSFEGGLGPEPFCEAHGGYSFCGIASLCLLKRLDAIDIPSFIRWLVSRQMIKEGGFNGRTNKLVDSCYSFWQGSIFNMLMNYDKAYTYEDEMIYDQLSLQAYLLFACQSRNGGFRDKPGKTSDAHHSNYGELGLILSTVTANDNIKKGIFTEFNELYMNINPIFGVREDKINEAIEFFRNKKKGMEESKGV